MTNSTASGGNPYRVSDDAHPFSTDALGSTTAPPALDEDRSRDGTTAPSDDLIGQVFDQTNGVVDGLSGESDGSAAGETQSGGERGNSSPTFDDAELRGDDEGVRDLRDQNP